MTITPKWKCCECGEIHDYESDAIECCPPTVREVYPCPVCGDPADDEDEAMACCNADEELVQLANDGRQFPAGIQDTNEYIKAFCEANNLRF